MKEGNICVKHVRPSQSGETESISEFRIVSGLFAVYGHSFFVFSTWQCLCCYRRECGLMISPQLSLSLAWNQDQVNLWTYLHLSLNELLLIKYLSDLIHLHLATLMCLRKTPKNQVHVTECNRYALQFTYHHCVELSGCDAEHWI